MSDIREIVAANRDGRAVGLPCFCTANGPVLRAVLRHAARSGGPVVIEATCNQVNQEGGYTGMSPADFVAWLSGMAAEAGVPMDRVILGGDHLGPTPWKAEPDAEALAKARDLVRLYVEAGFRKIHLDASMPLGGEAPPSFETIAGRAADLCAVAEAHAPDPAALVYVIGTEVPVPGGETEEPDALDVTSVGRFRDTVETHRAAFGAAGLEAAWQRIVAVVTQPGVDFGHSRVYPYDAEAAAPLSAAIAAEDGLVFEAHSTDYQPDAGLAALVASHFAFLKVGPELTFRFREAVFALAAIEAEMAPAAPSRLREVIERRMLEADGPWRAYYQGSEAELARMRRYSYSDRIRYYWADREVAEALERLVANLRATPPPETLVSQHFAGLPFGRVPTDPEALIEGHVGLCIDRYARAAGQG